jgi:hypothetical protein
MSEKARLDELVQRLLVRFRYEAICQRLIREIRSFTYSLAKDWSLWGATEFAVRVENDPAEPSHPMVLLRPIPMTAEAFEDILGYAPVDDDVDRVNCPDAGKPGHQMCGWCDHHWTPRSVCGCFPLFDAGTERGPLPFGGYHE